MARYTATAGSNFDDADAAVLGPALSEVARRHPDATNETILELAADERSPFHPYVFKHDDTEAARRHRVSLIRNMVRSILVEYEAGGETRTMRAFEYIEIVREPVAAAAPPAAPSVRPTFASATFGNRNESRRIVTAEYVLSHEEATAEVVANAEAQLRAFQAKYDGYMRQSEEFRRRFGPLWREIEALFAQRPPRRRRGT